MRFTTDDKQILMDVSDKHYIEKCLLKMFLTEDEVLMG